MEQFIENYYFQIAIPMHIILFVLLYKYERTKHDYAEGQAIAMFASWLWPLSLIILGVFLIFTVTFFTLFILFHAANSLMDKTIGRWL